MFDKIFTTLIVLITVFTFSFPKYAQAADVATTLDNIVSHWELEESSGTRTDSAGSNDLTDNNTVGQDASGIQGNAADFIRSNSERLSHADNASLSITGDISVSAWINLAQLPSSGGQMTILSKFQTGGGKPRGYFFNINASDQLQFAYRNGSDQHSGCTGAGTNFSGGDVGNWVHVGAACDVSANSCDLYIDGAGISESCSGSAGSIVDSSAEFNIGSLDPAGATTDYFDGSIDEVTLTSDIITSGEMSTIYNAGAGIPYEDAGGGGGAVFEEVIMFD